MIWIDVKGSINKITPKVTSHRSDVELLKMQHETGKRRSLKELLPVASNKQLDTALGSG